MTQSRDPATIAAAIRSARDYVATEPSAARSADTAAHARLLDGLRVAVAGPNGWHVETDMAKSVGGGAAGPTPGWLFRAALASCDAVLIAIQCAEEGIELSTLETEVTSESDNRGLLGDETVPPGPFKMTLTVQLEAAGRSRAELAAVVKRALRRSPVSDAVRREVRIDVRLA